MVSTRQRATVDRRVQQASIAGATLHTNQGTITDVGAALNLAFVLGIRFGIAHPDISGDFMARWIGDRTLRLPLTDIELAIIHERVMESCTHPLMWTEEDFDHHDN